MAPFDNSRFIRNDGSIQNGVLELDHMLVMEDTFAEFLKISSGHGLSVQEALDQALSEWTDVRRM